MIPPKVSIIMPSYNSSGTILASIRSIQEQSTDDWELIIVDDCSTDASVEIVRALAEIDKRIKLIVLPKNSGAAVARNAGIAAASGKYISFLDSDDLWHSDKLRRQVEFMSENEYAFSFCWYNKVNESGSAIGGAVMAPLRLSYRDLLRQNHIGCLTAMYDSEALGKFYAPLMRKRQDYGLWLSILRTGVDAHCLPEPLASYRVRPNSISSNKIGLLRYNWYLFRHCERLSIPSSVFFLMCNVYAKIAPSHK